MILHKADLRHLKWSLLLLLAVSCSGGMAVFASHSFLAHAQDARRTALLQLDAARQRLASAEEDRRNMDTYTQEYVVLRKSGFIGKSHRMECVEEMERIRRKLHFPEFSYTLAPQRPLPIAQDSGHGLPGASTSSITLQLILWHEEQLLDLLGDLRTSTHGMFILDNCTMERTPGDAPPLKATCSGQWLTLNPGDTT